MRKFKKALKMGGRERMTKSDWREIQRTLGSDAGPGTRRKANRRMTKTQRKANAARSSKKRRIATALAKYLKSLGIKNATHARVKRNPGGSITVIPIRVKRK